MYVVYEASAVYAVSALSSFVVEQKMFENYSYTRCEIALS